MKVVVLWLINEQNQILLARRAFNKTSDAGVWGPSVTGKVEAGETLVEAVIREAQEELQVAPNQIIPVFLHSETHEHKDGHTREFEIFYTHVKKSIVKTLILDPNDVAEVQWFSLADIREMVIKKKEELIISHDTVLWNSALRNLELVMAD